MPLNDFNEIKESSTLSQANAGKPIKFAGLVTGVQHRTTKTGRNFGILTIEDYSGKTELALFGEDYQSLKQYLDLGKNLMVNGTFKAPWKEGASHEFKVANINLLESVKQNQTKGIEISMHPTALTPEFVKFISTNAKQNPGKSSLRFHIYEPEEQLKISLYNSEKGISLNEELTTYLLNNQDIDINVLLNGNN
jgi:DNA polymerase-3 subunit alpha